MGVNKRQVGLKGLVRVHSANNVELVMFERYLENSYRNLLAVRVDIPSAVMIAPCDVLPSIRRRGAFTGIKSLARYVICVWTGGRVGNGRSRYNDIFIYVHRAVCNCDYARRIIVITECLLLFYMR